MRVEVDLSGTTSSSVDVEQVLLLFEHVGLEVDLFYSSLKRVLKLLVEFLFEILLKLKLLHLQLLDLRLRQRVRVLPSEQLNLGCCQIGVRLCVHQVQVSTRSLSVASVWILQSRRRPLVNIPHVNRMA